MKIDFSNADELKTFLDLCEKERARLSNWISSLDKRGLTVDRTLVLRLEHATKMTHAVGALYGEVLFPTEDS